MPRTSIERRDHPSPPFRKKSARGAGIEVCHGAGVGVRDPSPISSFVHALDSIPSRNLSLIVPPSLTYPTPPVSRSVPPSIPKEPAPKTKSDPEAFMGLCLRRTGSHQDKSPSIKTTLFMFFSPLGWISWRDGPQENTAFVARRISFSSSSGGLAAGEYAATKTCGTHSTAGKSFLLVFFGHWGGAISAS